MDLVSQSSLRRHKVKMPLRLRIVGMGLVAGSLVDGRDGHGRALLSSSELVLPVGFRGAPKVGNGKLRTPLKDVLMQYSRFFINGSRFHIGMGAL